MVVSRCFCLSLITALLVAAVPTAAASSAFEGYTFVFNGSNAYLYGMDKEIVHKWTGLPQNAFCADLLRDSSILWPSSDRGEWTRGGVAGGGRLQIVKWDGTVTWDFRYRSADYMPHHDIEPVYYTNDPREKPNVLVICYTVWGDKITELKPTGLNTAEVVWEWYASDHTCDSGTGTDKPELIDKGKGSVWGFPKTASAGMGSGDIDKMHTNNVSFNRTLNQIVFSTKNYNEIMVIDHSTTTAQAKTHSGGKYGKGGDILYRWGMPSNYGASGTQQIRGQHGGCWIPDTLLGSGLPIPGAFNMMCVDNGNKRVVEIVPAGTKNGVYPRTAGTAFAPASALWTYSVSDMAGNEGSVQRLPNGNTVICNGGGGIMGGAGRVVEINAAGTVVWELKDIPPSTEGYRYPYGYLDGKTGVTVETTPEYSTLRTPRIAVNSLTGRISLVSKSDNADARLSLFSMDGRELLQGGVSYAQGWDLGNRPNGQYLVQIRSGNDVIRERIIIRR